MGLMNICECIFGTSGRFALNRRKNISTKSTSWEIIWPTWTAGWRKDRGRNCGLLAEFLGSMVLWFCCCHISDTPYIFATILIWYHRFVAAMVLLHILILWFFLILILSILSFYLRRQIGGEWCGFMCCIVVDTLWRYLVLSWFKFCCCHAFIHHSSAAHKSPFGTGFYGYLTGFSA